MSTQNDPTNSHKSIDDFRKQATDGSQIEGGGEMEAGLGIVGGVDPMLDLSGDVNAASGSGDVPSTIVYKPTQIN